MLRFNTWAFGGFDLGVFSYARPDVKTWTYVAVHVVQAAYRRRFAPQLAARAAAAKLALKDLVRKRGSEVHDCVCRNLFDMTRVASALCSEDKEFVLKLVALDEKTFEFAHKSLRGDKATVLEVMHCGIQGGATAIRHASAELRADRELMLIAAKYSMSFYLTREHFENDEEMILTNLQHDATGFVVHSLKGMRAFQKVQRARVAVFDEELMARVWHPKGAMFKYFLLDDEI